MAKLTKKELRHDPVREFLTKAFNALMAKPERLYWTGGLIAILLLFSIYRGLNKPRPNPTAELGLLQAITYLASNDTSNASKMLNTLVSTYGRTQEGKKAHYYLATLALDRGDTAQAREHLNAFLKSGIRDPYLEAFALAKLGDLALDQGDFEKAVSLYAKAAKKIPVEAYQTYLTLKQIRALRFAGQYQRALDLLKAYQASHDLGSFAIDFREEEAMLKGALAVSQAKNAQGG